jgi:hypothetical protein
MKNNTTRSSERSRLFAHIFFTLGFLTFSYMIGMLVLMDLERGVITFDETLLLLGLTATELIWGQRLLTRSQQERFEEHFNRKGERCAR